MRCTYQHRHARFRIPALTIVIAVGLLAQPGLAQSAGAGSGPLSEVSRGVSDGSRPVHQRGRTVREGSVGSMISGPVRGNRRVGMLSGPVSDISAGPVTAGRSMTGGGSVAENSAGAVKQEMDSSLGERVYDLQRVMAPLQAQVRQQAELDAAAAAQEAAEPVDAASEPDTDEPTVDLAADIEPEDDVDAAGPPFVDSAAHDEAADEPTPTSSLE